MIALTNQTCRFLGLITFLSLLFLLTLSAKDFWEEKPFTQWNEKQAHKILSDSPWGKTQMVALGGSEADFEGRREGSGIPRSDGNLGGTAGGVEPGGTGVPGDSSRTGTPAGAGADRGERGRSLAFQVVWYSSTKARQALGRLGQLRGNVSEEQINQFAQQPMENYVIAVSGPMMKPFEQASLENLKTKTFLLAKKDKNKKIELKEYVSPKDRKDGMALFVFPRTADGKPLLDVSDDEAQFVTEQGPLRLKASFKLAKMMTEGKLDL